MNEIKILQKLSSKNEYVINYLDTFATILGDEYKVYHIVTDIYEVNFFLILYHNNYKDKQFFITLQKGRHFRRCNRRYTSRKQRASIWGHSIVDLSIIEGHWFSSLEQFDSSRLETFVNRKNNIYILRKCLCIPW